MILIFWPNQKIKSWPGPMQVCTSEPAQNKKNVKITHAGFDCYNHLQPPWLEFFHWWTAQMNVCGNSIIWRYQFWKNRIHNATNLLLTRKPPKMIKMGPIFWVFAKMGKNQWNEKDCFVALIFHYDVVKLFWWIHFRIF